MVFISFIPSLLFKLQIFCQNNFEHIKAVFTPFTGNKMPNNIFSPTKMSAKYS